MMLSRRISLWNNWQERNTIRVVTASKEMLYVISLWNKGKITEVSLLGCLQADFQEYLVASPEAKHCVALRVSTGNM